jgi:hypothetical protein
MYDPAEMMEIFSVCVALAGIAYICQLLAPMEPSALPKRTLEYSIYGDLTLPTDFYEWVHVQLTDAPVCNPVDLGIVMNYPDAYVDPAAYKYFLSTNILPDGTVAFKPIGGSSPIMTAGLADRSCRLCPVSSDMERANVAVKDSLQFGATPGWGFFRMNQTELDDLWRKP